MSKTPASPIDNLEEEKPPKLSWDSFREAGLIDNAGVQLLNSINIDIVDENSIRQIVKTILEKSQDFVNVFTKVLTSVSQDAPQKFVLYMIDTTLDYTDREWKELKDLKTTFLQQLFDAAQPKLFKALLDMTDKSDIFLLERTFRTVARLLDFDYRTRPQSNTLLSVYEAFLEKIARALEHQGKEVRHAKYATFALVNVIRKPESRDLFHKQQGVRFLMDLLKYHPSNVQIIYEVAFCCWVLSYSKEKIPIYFQDIKIVPELHNLLRNVQTEKVIRMVLGTFKNFVGTYGMINEMISVGVPKTLSSLVKRKFEDEDIKTDATKLITILEQHIEEISSFDEYRQEVLSGNLEWTPVHTSEKFWKENMAKFEQNNFYILKELIKLLDTSSLENAEGTTTQENQPAAQATEEEGKVVVNIKNENRTLAIACHDIGEFVRYHPRGRR
jgi:V-type H+-transporting ATPase subunit H